MENGAARRRQYSRPSSTLPPTGFINSYLNTGFQNVDPNKPPEPALRERQKPASREFPAQRLSAQAASGEAIAVAIAKPTCAPWMSECPVTNLSAFKLQGML